MDERHFAALSALKQENYNKIYLSDTVKKEFDLKIRPMMLELYEKLLCDLKEEKNDSPVFTQHIDYVKGAHYERRTPYEDTEPNQIVVDYIASMTDDYFIDLHRYLFPKSPHKIEYRGYFGQYEN